MRAPTSGCFFICSNSSLVSRPVFCNTAFGDADLADVVEQAGHVNLVHFLTPRAQVAGRELAAEQGHAFAMAARVGVFGVHRAGEAVQ